MTTDKKLQPYPGMRVRITKNAAFFPGKEAAVAYVGTEGISVYLVDGDLFDDCLPLNNDEWEPLVQGSKEK